MHRNRSNLSREPQSLLPGTAIVLLLAAALTLPTMATAQGQAMGKAYRALDAQVTRVTVQLEDAYIVTDRSPEGSLQSTLFDPAGKALIELHVAVDERDLELYGGDGKSLGAPSYIETAEVSSTWAGRQLYSLWSDLQALGFHKTDGLGNAAGLNKAARNGEWTWQGGFLRLRDPATALETSAKAHRQAIESKVVAVNTRFGDLEAVSIRDEMAELPRVGPKGELAAPAFITRLLDQTTGQPIGRALWYSKERTFTWDIPGLSSGLVNEERMERSFPFDPDMSWSNLQLFGLRQTHLDLALEEAQAPFKNTVGCDYLHWLDDTIFRPCCDQHDLCYEKNGCTARSWWIFGASWSCIKCNIAVVVCFATGGGGGGGLGGGGGISDPNNPGGSSCGAVGSACPAYCTGDECLNR